MIFSLKNRTFLLIWELYVTLMRIVSGYLYTVNLISFISDYDVEHRKQSGCGAGISGKWKTFIYTNDSVTGKLPALTFE